MNTQADFQELNNGHFRPLTDAAKKWADEYPHYERGFIGSEVVLRPYDVKKFRQWLKLDNLTACKFA